MARPGSTAPVALIVGAPSGITVVHLAAPQVLVGRGSDCDVVIDHPSLSQRHACISLPPARLVPTLEDLCSERGTRIGQVRLEAGKPVELGYGVFFRVGDVPCLLERRRDIRSVLWRPVGSWRLAG